MSKIFNCKGKVNLHDWSLQNSGLLLQNELNDISSKKISHLNYNIFDVESSGISILLNLKHYIRCMEANLKFFCRYEKSSFELQQNQNEDIKFLTLREDICKFIIFLRCYLPSVAEEGFSFGDLIDEAERDFDDLYNTIHRFLSRLQYIADSTFLYATSNVGNMCKQPEYHMYHLHLDLRWQMIMLIYMRNHLCNGSVNNLEELENNISMAIADLIFIAIKIFATISNVDLRSRTPYSCTCGRELWIMLQILSDKLYTENKCKTFWDHVNSILDCLLQNGSIKSIPVFQRDLKLPQCKNPELFCIWIIHHLTLLYGYSESGEYFNNFSTRFLEHQTASNLAEIGKVLKSYVNKGGKDGERDEIDEELSVMIPLLHNLICEWWKPQPQIITLLWDCFHKRLDKPFLLQNRGPWSTSSEKKTPMDILNSVRDRLSNACDVHNESSFGLFLRLLGTFLQKYFNKSDFKIWNQVRGRVYSRFSPNKIQEFSECGLYNFISLFMTLALTADLVNVYTTITTLLPSVLESNDSVSGKKSCLIWKSKLAFLILFKEQKLPFTDIAESFRETANAISCRKDDYSRSMMTWFIDVLRIILIQSEGFHYDEQDFLGGWVDRYLLECSPNKIGVMTTTLLKVFEKCRDLQSNNSGKDKMLDALWNHVASRVRQMVTTCDLSSESYENPTRLAICFTLQACYDPITAKKYRHSAVSLFLHFTTSIIIKDVRIIRLYLTEILQNHDALQILKSEVTNFNNIVVQVWVKCSILNHESNNETNFLKNYVASLSEIKEILNCNDDLNEFISSSEPIITFLTIISRRRSMLQTDQQRISFDSQCRPYFQNLDKWVLQLVSEENKDSPLALWIYRCVGTVIFCCSPILFVNNQSSNMFKMLIKRMALPEQSSQIHLMQLSQRIFSMIILSFENLNVKAEISLQTLIRELFERYLPLLIKVESNHESSCKVADSLLKCFLDAKSSFTRSVITMLGCNFITITSNSTHKHCHLVMLLLRNLIRAGKTYSIDIIESIISLCTSQILDCFMRVHEMHPHKRHTKDFLRDICTNPYYRENVSLRENLNAVVWTVFKKYFHTNSKVCFEFLAAINKTNAELFRYLYSRVEQLVLECERNKQMNAASLRYSFNSLKRSIELLQSKS